MYSFVFTFYSTRTMYHWFHRQDTRRTHLFLPFTVQAPCVTDSTDRTQGGLICFYLLQYKHHVSLIPQTGHKMDSFVFLPYTVHEHHVSLIPQTGHKMDSFVFYLIQYMSTMYHWFHRQDTRCTHLILPYTVQAPCITDSTDRTQDGLIFCLPFTVQEPCNISSMNKNNLGQWI